MTQLLGLLLFLCCGLHFFSVDAQKCLNFRFSLNKNMKLRCSIYKTLPAVNQIACHKKCVAELSCFSVNFYQSENGTNVCELIKGTKSSLGTPDCLVKKQGSEYNELMNEGSCSSSVPCEAGKTRKALPGNWYQLGSSAFKLFEQKKNYTEASAVCIANGGTLATNKSDDENIFVAELFLKEEVSKREVKVNLLTQEKLKPLKRWKLDGSDQEVALLENLVAEKDENNISAALRFTGALGSYATTPVWDISTMTFSISLWLKLQNYPTNTYSLYSYWSNPYIFTLRVDSSGGIQFYGKKKSDLSPGGQLILYAGKVVLNEWTHIVVVRNREAKQTTLYQDGTKLFQTAPSTTTDFDFPAPTRSVFDVGYDRYSNWVMKGWLRELLVFDRAVTSEEVNIIQDATLLDPRIWIGPQQSYLNMAPVSKPKTNCFSARVWGTYQWEEVRCDRTMKFVCKKIV